MDCRSNVSRRDNFPLLRAGGRRGSGHGLLPGDQEGPRTPKAPPHRSAGDGSRPAVQEVLDRRSWDASCAQSRDEAGWVAYEAARLGCPCLAHGFVGREGIQGFEPLGGVVGVEAVVQWQQRVAAESDDHRLLLGAEHRGARRLRPHRSVVHEGPLAPLGDRLVVQPVPGGELLKRSLRSRYRSSDRVRGRGAAMVYLSHNASRNDGSASLIPPYPRTRQLRPWLERYDLGHLASKRRARGCASDASTTKVDSMNRQYTTNVLRDPKNHTLADSTRPTVFSGLADACTLPTRWGRAPATFVRYFERTVRLGWAFTTASVQKNIQSS